ncbi:MAG: creatininase family protein [Rhodospirillales bacterium]|nr:creatininase family protein [Rhodospirillales bacterium]
MPLWEDMVTTDFAALDPARAVALLPVAAIEQHGPHLPLGTDAILCDAILDRTQNIVADPASLLRLPTQRVGLSPEHAGFPGTLVLRAESLLTAWTEIGLSVAAAGVRKLVLFNTHGGQGGLVDIVAQQLRCRAGMLVVRCSSYRFALPEGWVPPDELRFGLHGGLIETSMMLAAAPSLVRRGFMHSFHSPAADWEAAHPGLEVEGESGIAWCAQDLGIDGVTGDASAATAELGQRLLDHYASRLAKTIAAARSLVFPPQSQPDAPSSR